MIYGGICRVANPSLSGVTSVLISQILFGRLPEEEKATFEKNNDLYQKDYLGFDDEDGKYFEDLAEGLDGKHVTFQLLDLDEYRTLY
tara:strand:- start:58 stop:318 length:261 start_codon:yes stop_codon:yes gene_type:complete